MIYTDYLNTPIGVITIRASMQGIIRVDFSAAENHTVHHSELTDRCKQQLHEYFSGKRRLFDLPLDQQGTPFQRTVWDNLIQIPFGQVVSYANIAEKINNKKAVRAVGAANGKNPIGIIVPDRKSVV